MRFNAAIDWIAYNDEPGSDLAMDPDFVAGLTTVQMVADVSNNPPIYVARMVVAVRTQIEHRRDQESEDGHGFNTPRGEGVKGALSFKQGLS